jgi:hypothetical protein
MKEGTVEKDIAFYNAIEVNGRDSNANRVLNCSTYTG